MQNYHFNPSLLKSTAFSDASLSSQESINDVIAR